MCPHLLPFQLLQAFLPLALQLLLLNLITIIAPEINITAAIADDVMIFLLKELSFDFF
jgi:hypothetical protein